MGQASKQMSVPQGHNRHQGPGTNLRGPLGACAAAACGGRAPKEGPGPGLLLGTDALGNPEAPIVTVSGPQVAQLPDVSHGQNVPLVPHHVLEP